MGLEPTTFCILNTIDPVIDHHCCLDCCLDPLQVEQFWAHYCYLARPCELPPHCDIHLFKKGIKPMWEVLGNHHKCMALGACLIFLNDAHLQDDTNKNGGKWMIRLKKGISSRCWENLVPTHGVMCVCRCYRNHEMPLPL